jgi:hypothetical protein
MPTDPSTAPTPPAWAELTRKRLRVKLTRSPSTAPKARGHGHLGRVTKGCPGLIEIQPIGHVVQTVPGVAVSDGYIRGGRAPSRVGWRTGRAGLRATGGAFWCVHPQSRAYACSGNALRFNQAGGQQIEAAESRDDPSDQGGDAHWISSLTRGRAYQQVRKLQTEVLRSSQIPSCGCRATRAVPLRWRSLHRPGDPPTPADGPTGDPQRAFQGQGCPGEAIGREQRDLFAADGQR